MNMSKKIQLNFNINASKKCNKKKKLFFWFFFNIKKIFQIVKISEYKNFEKKKTDYYF